jgi:hypothetical protein
LRTARRQQRRAEKFWPAWTVLFAFGVAYTVWAASNYNPFGFMVGLHLALGFGLLTWTPETAAGLRAVGERALRRQR